ncbi:MAG TPA: FecR family protein [Spirochaetia bacterium]
MKSTIIGFVLVLCAAVALSAAPADVTYTEGDATVRTKAGASRDAQIGDTLVTGDTLRTGHDGLAELDQKGVTIRVAKDTVFTLMERQVTGQPSTVLSVALGSIKFKYDKLTGAEPAVRTNGASAGVRGTEFSVYAGADGSTLITVDSGLVTVESQGKSVDLVADMGVDIPLGQPPGDPFTVQRNQIDYAQWNEAKIQVMLYDPLAALDNIETAMATYIKDVEQYDGLFKEYSAKLAEERANRTEIGADKGTEAAKDYDTNVVMPLVVQTAAVGLNLRYSTLAALSLRRFVAGRLYVTEKTKYIATPDDPAWISFQTRYSALLTQFEQSIAPHLVEADI